ncbi:MAG TPA: single-stranded DNA-binding protein [Bacteroidota bacterium]|nr:single-stranded DNA-binding protein [Candidatus Kapabacteria bacterium]HRS01479.1 single-stranded DNA-binding protein [Bacteroidota bacterium]
MSRSLNKVLLIGNVGVDPIMKKTPGGIPVISFRMATSQTWKDRAGNLREQTDWHTVIAWRGLAEIVERIIHKGARIFVEGRLQSRVIEDKLTQRQRQVVEILADNILLLEGKDKINGINRNGHKSIDSNLGTEDIQFNEEENFFDNHNEPLNFDDFNFDSDIDFTSNPS